MKITTTTTTILLLGIFACCFANPTTKRPETPIYDDGENEDPFFEEREQPIDEATWALWNQNPDRNCPWWEQHRPGGDYEFSDYPSPLHVQRHMAKCQLNHDFGSSSGSGSGSGQSSPQGSQSSSQKDQSSRKGSSSSSSVEILDPIDIIRRSQSRSPSIVEVPVIRPGNFEDFYLRQNQEPDFLPNPVSGNEIFIENTPQSIEIFIDDEASTSTGRRNGKGRPTGRPEACLKKKSNEKDGAPASKKQKIYNMAEGCEVMYIPSDRESPNDVHLVCTSNLGVQQTVAEYQVVDCSSENNDENDIEMPQTTETALPFQVNFEDDDDDHNGKVAKFNDAFTLAILEATQGQFHNCVQLVDLQNKTIGRRQKRLAWFFGPVVALIIAAVAIEHEASKIPKCPPNFIIYGRHCIKKGGSNTCPRGFVDLRFLKEPQK